MAAMMATTACVFHMPIKIGNSAMNPEKPGIPIDTRPPTIPGRDRPIDRAGPLRDWGGCDLPGQAGFWTGSFRPVEGISRRDAF